MNVIQMLSSQPWVARLGETLIHFLWQGIVIAGLYAAARRSMTRPNARYALACVALAAMTAAPPITWVVLGSSDAAPAAASLAAGTPSAASTAVTMILSERTTSPPQFLPWIVAIWLAGALACSVRLAGGWLMAIRLRTMLVRPAPEEWRQAFDNLKARLGVSRTVRLVVSPLVQAPAVIGWLRPIVLAPVGALSGLPSEYVEALLLHELAHIRRRDYLVNLLQSVVETLLFYHPAIWWVSGHIRAEREMCCDDVAAAASGDTVRYARALAEFASLRPGKWNPAVAANGGPLTERIGRLLGQSRLSRGTLTGPEAMVTSILLIATAYVMFGQSAPLPKFEVTSVKVNLAAPGLMVVAPRPGGRLVATNAPLWMLIQNAYSLQRFQISGGPGWIDAERFDIEAKAAANNASREQLFLMLRGLLEDRFKLKVHRETKEMAVYALSVTRGGLKRHQNEVGCVARDPNAPGAPPAPPPPGRPPSAAECGRIVVNINPSGIGIRGGKAPIQELIRILGTVMGKAVIDKTGITDTFDVNLDFTPDESLGGLPPFTPDPAKPTIFAALQEQLGLKLDSAKGPVEMLVIDHAEKPSVN